MSRDLGAGHRADRRWVGQRLRPPRRLGSAPGTRNRFLASLTSRSARLVSIPKSQFPSRPVARHPASGPRGAPRAKWTPPPSSVPIWTVTPMAGPGSGISKRTAIPAPDPGGKGTAPPEEGLRPQLGRDHTSDNCCLPHTSVRLPWPQP
jgi:hypothetical protein